MKDAEPQSYRLSSPLSHIVYETPRQQCFCSEDSADRHQEILWGVYIQTGQIIGVRDNKQPADETNQ